MDEHTGETVRVAVLAGDEGTIADATFTDCDVYGPAVVYLGEGSDIKECVWGGNMDSVLWLIPTGKREVVGVVHLLRSSFVNCRFHKVGLVVPQGTADKFLDGFD